MFTPRCRCRAVIFTVIALSLAPAAQARAQEKVFRAGAHAQDITPTQGMYPISVNGGMTDRQAAGAHDRLHARCLVLDDGRTKVAFAVCDSCMIPRPITEAARKLAAEKTGIPARNILISATHTHTAPTVGGVYQSDPDEDYVAYLTKQIANGIEKAHANLEPARVGWGVGRDETQVFNRRWLMKPDVLNPDPFGRTTDKVRMNPGYRNPGLVRPAGPIDPEISLLSVQSRDGRPIAVLANYSLHYVGGVQPLSADYFAAFADRLAQLIGAQGVSPPFVGIMSNGTSGDINNVNYGAANPGRQGEYEQIQVVANSVAEAALQGYRKIEYRDWVSLDAASKDITLGVRKPADEEIARARDILAAAKGKPLVSREEIYARETVLLAEYPETVEVMLQAIRVGDLGIAAIPCEVFVQIGLDIKKNSPLKHTFTIELANGYNGYLPTPEQHALGGYETWRARSSYLEVGASPRIAETVLALLRQVAKSQ